MTNTATPFPGSHDGEAAERLAVPDPPSAGVRILIMDDEPAVLAVAAEFLQYVGYRVDTVANGAAAIRAYQRALESGDLYRLVMLDLLIDTGMGGKEAMERLREIDPQVQAVIVSGNAGDPLIKSYAAHGFAASLLKPYRLEQLEEMLTRLLT